MIETFEDYAEFLNEKEDQEKYCGDDPEWDDDNHNDNHHDIPKEVQL